MLHIASKTISEWTAAREKRNHATISLSQQRQYPTRWEKPTEGLCKLNVDATLFSQRGLVGFGCVLRGATGAFISDRVSTARLNLQPHEAEAMSVREALTWIKYNNIPNLIVEMDSQLVYNALMDSSDAFSPFGMIIKDCKRSRNSYIFFS